MAGTLGQNPTMTEEGARDLFHAAISLPLMGYQAERNAIQQGEEHGSLSPEQVRALISVAALPMIALGGKKGGVEAPETAPDPVGTAFEAAAGREVPPVPVRAPETPPTAAEPATAPAEPKVSPVAEAPQAAQAPPRTPIAPAATSAPPSPAMDALRRVMAPAGRTPESALTGLVIRARTGQLAHVTEQTMSAFKDASDEMSQLTPAARLDFIDKMESGTRQASPQLQTIADGLRTQLDQTRDVVRSLGTGKLDNFIENYFPHIWDNPDQARSIFGRRPLEGPRSFLKTRTIPTTAEGIAQGLKPVTDNPVDLTMLKLYEMRRYITGQKIMDDLQQRNLVQYVRAGTQAPDGFARLDDRVATVFAPPELRGKAGVTILGNYYAPEPVATVFNNHLSPGLRGNALFDAYRAVGNTLNQAQLGLSAYHLGFTSMESIVSRNALAFRQLFAGEPLQAAKTAASSVVAPVTNILRGDKVLRAYLRPDDADPMLLRTVDALERAGGRIRMSTLYENNASANFLKALRAGQYGQAALRFVPAALEQAARPVMEYVVPRQKLGVFADLAKFELGHLPPNATPDMATAAFARAWDSVDNRMGQLVYDNLFWNRALKDLSMVSVRSVGWNLGTIREFGGGTADILANLGKAAVGHSAELTPRASYVLSLPFSVGLAGGIAYYLMNGKPPETLLDYFYPRTGRVDPEGVPERVQLPSYLKDVVHFSQAPWQTMKNKVNPLAALIGEMLENKDFYGDQIRNPHDPLVQQVAQVAEHVAGQFEPFGIRYFQQQHAQGQSLGTSLGSFVGVTPAPRSIVRTNAENLMATLVSHTPATPEQRAQFENLRSLRQALARGEPDAVAHLQEAFRAGKISGRQLQNLWRSTRTPAEVGQFKRLPMEDAIRVIRVATPQEDKLFWPLLIAKARGARSSRNGPALAAFAAYRAERERQQHR